MTKYPNCSLIFSRHFHVTMKHLGIINFFGWTMSTLATLNSRHCCTYPGTGPSGSWKEAYIRCIRTNFSISVDMEFTPGFLPFRTVFSVGGSVKFWRISSDLSGTFSRRLQFFRSSFPGDLGGPSTTLVPIAMNNLTRRDKSHFGIIYWPFKQMSFQQPFACRLCTFQI